VNDLITFLLPTLIVARRLDSATSRRCTDDGTFLKKVRAAMQNQPDPMQRYERAYRPRSLLRGVVSGLVVALLLGSCVALGLIPALAAGQDSPRSHAFQLLFSALFALLGLLVLLTERQLRRAGWSRSPVSFVRLLFTTTAGLTFWAGLALVGIALARLEAPASAGPLNIFFWSVAGLWLLLEIILTALHLLRPRRAQAPGRDAGD
jgi:hypothetical protein